MANRYPSPVLFAMEKNVVFVACRAIFGANGAVALDTNNSKGVCSIAPYSVPFSGNTVASSTSISSITSFAQLYNGMTVTGLTSTVGAAVTISSMTAGTGTLVLSSGTNVTTQQANALLAAGGQYIVQFGTQAATRLDGYNKLLSIGVDWREVTGSASGTSSQLALYPQATDSFVVKNNIQVRTIPATTTSGSTDCSVTLQFGFYGSNNNIFTVATPAPGEVAHMMFVFGNSTSV